MALKECKLLFIVLLFSKSILCQEWESVNTFPDINNHHAVGFSFNDKGYIVTGGDTTIATKKFFEYDASTNEWTRKDDFPGEERSYAIGDFYDGKQYIGFGANYSGTSQDLFLNDLWSYDPQNDSWKELASCPCKGRQHPSFNALNGKIYVGLGSGDTGDRDDFWAYDIATNSWSQKADFIGGIRHHPYHFALGDFVFVGFGHNHMAHDVKKDWYRYDSQDDSWTRLNDLPAEGRVAGTQFSSGGFGYALSGQGEDLSGGFHHPMEEGEFWKYDPHSDIWSQLTSHPGKSRYAPASFVINGYVYIISGLYDELNQTPVMRLKLDESSSINEEEFKFDIKVSPNPADHYLNFLIDEKPITFIQQVIIYDVNGQLISKQENLRNTTIDISNLKNGNYLLSVIIDGNHIDEVFTKMN